MPCQVHLCESQDYLGPASAGLNSIDPIHGPDSTVSNLSLKRKNALWIRSISVLEKPSAPALKREITWHGLGFQCDHQILWMLVAIEGNVIEKFAQATANYYHLSINHYACLESILTQIYLQHLEEILTNIFESKGKWTSCYIIHLISQRTTKLKFKFTFPTKYYNPLKSFRVSHWLSQSISSNIHIYHIIYPCSIPTSPFSAVDFQKITPPRHLEATFPGSSEFLVRWISWIPSQQWIPPTVSDETIWR